MDTEKTIKNRKKPEIADHLVVGDFVDVFSVYDKKWRLALILRTSDEDIEVALDGSMKKQIEIIPMNVNRVTFARKYTQGYTGEDYAGTRTFRELTPYSNELCQQKREELYKLIATKCVGVGAYQLNQIIRCKQFTFLDQVLSLSENENSVSIPVVLEYIKTQLDWIKFYFDQLSLYEKEFIKACINNYNNDQMDDKIEFCNCFWEVMESCSMIAGNMFRLLKPENNIFIKNFTQIQQHISSVFPLVSSRLKLKMDLADMQLYVTCTLPEPILKSYNFHRQIMNYFDQTGGFNSMFNLASIIPTRAIKHLLFHLEYSIKFFEDEDQKRFLNEHQLLYRIVENLMKAIEKIKEFDLESAKELINTYRYLFKKNYSQDQLVQKSESMQLQLIQKFFDSPYLEKRVKALSEIKDIIEKIDPPIYIQINPKMKPQSISIESLIQWIKSNKILENVLVGDNVHQELIKRAMEIATFLCKHNKFPIEIIQQIWKTSEGKHESTLSAIYTFFETISASMSPNDIDHLFEFIDTIKHYDEMTITLIQKTTENALQSVFRQNQSEQPKFYGFLKLWEIMQDGSCEDIPQGVREHAFCAIKNILHVIPHSQAFLKFFLGKCFELVRDHRSVYQAIQITHLILEKQFTNDQEGRNYLLRITNTQFGIIELFVREIEVYLEEARQFFGETNETQSVIISGVYTFDQNMYFRLQILNYLLTFSDLKLTYDQLIRLWTGCMIKTKGVIQKKELIKILSLDFQDRECTQKFFTQVLCSPDYNEYQKYTEEEFQYWRKMFFMNNINCRNIILVPYGFHFQLENSNFAGKSALWKLLECVEDQSVLSQLYSSNEKLEQERHMELMEYCLSLLPQNSERAIKVISSLLNYFQWGPSLLFTPQNINRKSKDLSARVLISNEVYVFGESDTTPVSVLRFKIAEKFAIPYKQIQLTVNSQVIDDEDELLGNLELVNQVIKVVRRTKYDPKTYLSQNEQAFGILFNLLENPSTSFECGRQILELLKKLPQNLQMEQNIRTMSVPWNKLFMESLPRVAYWLQIIVGFSHKDIEWYDRFKTSGGVHALYDFFMGLTFQPLDFETVFTVLDILNHQKVLCVVDVDESSLRLKCQDLIESLASQVSGQYNQIQQKFQMLLFKEIMKLVVDCEAFLFSVDIGKIMRQLLIENENPLLKQSVKEIVVNFVGDNHLPLLLQGLLTQVVEIRIFSCQQFFETLVMSCLRRPQWIQSNIEEMNSISQNLVQRLPNLSGQIRDGVLTFLEYFARASTSFKEKQGTHLIELVQRNILDGVEMTQAMQKCLQEIIRGSNSNISTFVQLFEPFEFCDLWRNSQYVNWSLQSKMMEKSTTGFVGIQNLACICYMNSLLQQLFMIPQFRESLLESDDYTDPSVDPEDNLLLQLQCLMSALKYSQKQYHNPKAFCHAFKTIEGLPTNVYEQMDVDEFFNLLMERVESSLKNDLVIGNFRGALVNEIVGSCQHISEREEAFFALSLPVKGKKTLQQSLQSIVQGDILEGDNAYHCDQCNKKVSAVKRMCLKRLPEQLILVLKRFEFDLDLMVKAKVNDRCEFPFELDMLPYCRSNTATSQEYSLRGVVVHQGSADSGHYYSFIREEEERWVEFNDTIVMEAERSDVINQGFGGKQKGQGWIENSRNAYLLFYERKEANVQESKPIKSPQRIQSRSNLLLQEFNKEIKEENCKFQILKGLFSDEFFSFIDGLLRENQLNSQMIKFCIRYFFVCGLRQQNKTWMIYNLSRCIHHIKQNKDIALWILLAFQQQYNIKEFLLDSPFASTRKYVVGLVENSAITAQNPIEVHNIIDQLLLNLSSLKQKNFTQFFELLYRLIRLHPAHAIQREAVGRLLEFSLNTSTDARIRKITKSEELWQFAQIPMPAQESPLLVYIFIKNKTPPPQQQFFGQQILNRDQSSIYDDELLDKRQKKSPARAQSKQYLWQALSLLVQSKAQFKVFHMDMSLYGALIDEGDCKQSILAIADMIAAIAYDNIKISNWVIGVCIEQVKDKHYQQYLNIFIVIEKLLAVEDQHQDTRINTMMNYLLELILKYTQYFFETDQCQQYIIQMCAINKKIYKWFSSCPAKVKQQLEIISIQENQNIKFQNNVNSQKQKHRLFGIFQPNTQEEQNKLLQWKKLQFNLILRNEPIQLPYFNPHITLDGYQIKEGDLVDYYVAQVHKWVQVKITFLNCEQLLLDFKQTIIDRDSEYLAPHKTLSQFSLLVKYQEISGNEEVFQKSPPQSPNPEQNEEMVIEQNDTEEGNQNSENSFSDENE